MRKVTSKKGIARIRRVIVGILPCFKITSLNRDAHSATHVCSDMLRLTGSPVKSGRKVVGKDQSILRKSGKLGSSQTVSFSKGTWHHDKNR